MPISRKEAARRAAARAEMRGEITKLREAEARTAERKRRERAAELAARRAEAEAQRIAAENAPPPVPWAQRFSAFMFGGGDD